MGVSRYGDDDYEEMSKEEALRRLEMKKTNANRPYTKYELELIAAVAGVEPPEPLPEGVMVSVGNLETIASMSCEHANQGGRSCDEADLERGGCCNFCWASRWAKRIGCEST